MEHGHEKRTRYHQQILTAVSRCQRPVALARDYQCL